jgi:hypothetical protein
VRSLLGAARMRGGDLPAALARALGRYGGQR